MPKTDVQILFTYHFYNEYTIGGGKGNGNIHSYMLRDIVGKPYIPASLIKGNVLHSAKMLVSLFPNAAMNELFGGEGNNKASLYFDNAILESDYYSQDASDMEVERGFSKRTGVTISRYTKSKHEGMLRTIQTSGQGGTMAFNGEIQGCLLKPKQAIPILVTAIRFPVALGGGKSRGLGWFCMLPECTVYVDGKSVTLAEVNEWVVNPG